MKKTLVMMVMMLFALTISAQNETTAAKCDKTCQVEKKCCKKACDKDAKKCEKVCDKAKKCEKACDKAKATKK